MLYDRRRKDEGNVKDHNLPYSPVVPSQDSNGINFEESVNATSLRGHYNPQTSTPKECDVHILDATENLHQTVPLITLSVNLALLDLTTN